MDRVTPFFGALVRETDPLLAQQYAMTAVGYFMQHAMGTAVAVDGFTCAPTTPASMSVVLGPGEILSLQNLEATGWSSLPADTAHSIVKQGIMKDPDPITLTAPVTVGYSQVYLIEVQYADLDTNPVLLSYYNSANPNQPFQGPGNNGQTQNTARLGIVAVQLKAGVAAPSGTQTAPSADAGWTGLYTVTVANGQTTITSGNISQVASAPFLPTNGKLPQIPTGVQNGSWIYGTSTGSANALVLNPTPVVTGYVAGQCFAVKTTSQNTGAVTLNVSSLGAKSVTRNDGAALAPGDLKAGQVVPLRYDGTNFQVQHMLPSQTGRPLVAGSLTLWVNSTIGNDTTGDGSANVAGVAFATIQKAVDYASQNYFTSGGTITIKLGATGTYTGVTFAYVGGTWVIEGNTLTPDSYVIQGAPPVAIAGSLVKLKGVKLYNTTTTYHNLTVGYGGSCYLDGAASFDGVGSNTAGAHMVAFPSGTIIVNASTVIKIMSAAGAVMSAVGGTINWLQSTTLNIPGTLNFPVAIVQAQGLGYVAVQSSYTTVTAATVTGKRYDVTLNAIINTSGSGSTYLPGNAAGTTATGGQYA